VILKTWFIRVNSRLGRLGVCVHGRPGPDLCLLFVVIARRPAKIVIAHAQAVTVAMGTDRSTVTRFPKRE